MTTETLRTLILSTFCSLALGSVIAEESQHLQLAARFTDNAILQRESKVPVWGWAEQD